MNILLLLIVHSVWSLDECFRWRTNCERNTTCRRELHRYISKCTIVSRPNLKCAQLKTRLNNGKCVTSATIGSLRGVSRFQSSSYIKVDVDDDVIDGVSSGHQLITSPNIGSFLNDNGNMLRRSTRSPISEEISQWKNQLNGELQQRLRSLDDFDCNRALYDVCLKHVSCRQLWNIFRTSCAVDVSNQCVMSNREDCWQSFEGISWTGLGNCTCHDRNSDCHWIRLQTRYNKCIYEISLSEDFPTSISFLSREWTLSGTFEIPERYRISSDHYQPSNPHFSSTANSDRPVGAPQPSHVVAESRDVEINAGRPSSISLLSEDSRPLQQQAVLDRHPLTSDHDAQGSKTDQSGTIQTEQRLQRVRPHLQPSASVQSMSDSLEESGSSVISSVRHNGTGSTRVGYQNHHSDISSTNHAKNLYQSRGSSLPQRFISGKSNTGQQLTTMQPPEIHMSRDRGNSMTAAGDERNSAVRPTHSDVATSENNSRNSYGIKQVTNDFRQGTDDYSRNKAAAERVHASYTVTRSTQPWRKSTISLSTTAPLTNINRSGNGQFRESGEDATEITARQGESRKASQPFRGIHREKPKQRHFSKNGFTTAQPVTTVPQPPIDKKLQRNDDYVGDLSGVANQSTAADRGRISESIISTTIIESESEFRQKNFSASTCIAAHHRCERSDTCKWHLSEVEIRCTGQCNRQLCAAALQRFTRYVARPSVESLMFCHCNVADKECLEHQQVMYPRCLYTDREVSAITCTDAVDKCRSDNQCQRFSSVFFQYCPVQNGQCTMSELDHCRQALIAIRGTYLEYPCYCPQNDPLCRKYQSAILPNNPCIERSMIEYSRLMSDIPPTNNYEQRTPPIQESNKARNDDQIDENEKTQKLSESKSRNDWNDGSSTTRPDLRTNENDRSGKYSNTNIEYIPKSVSRINLDEKHYYESDTASSSSLTDQPITLTGSTVESQNSGKQFTVSKAATDSRKNEKHHIANSTERKRINAKEKSAKGKQISAVSSPRIVGTAYVSPDKELSETIRLQSTVQSTSEPFVLLTQKHRNLTTSRSGTSSKSSAREHKDTTRIPLKPSTSGPYITHAPPPRGGCTTKDSSGNTITHYKGSIVRRYHDWSGRCSSWCNCSEDERLSCSKLPCMPDGLCTAPLTKIEHGERLYIKDRGACTCQSGVFICDQPEDLPELGPGIYILVGYSLDEVAMLKENVPKGVLERSGFVSEDNFVAHDIGSRLQIALERLMPYEVQCRIMFLEEFKSEGNIIFQMEWFGVNPRLNETNKRWHTGQAEKVCSPYVKRLADGISRNEAVRFQLVLSTIKQIRVLDRLDGLPDSAMLISSPSFQLLFLLLNLSIVRVIN
uniref:GDNF/GAS1 domain-containing protein n=1 Tax=Parascaris univalens TaxID=6257 RepID=A0A915B5X8_PARUN